MNFDAIQARLLDPLRCVGELFDHPNNVISGSGALLPTLASCEARHLHELIHRDRAHVRFIVGKRHRRNELFAILHRVDASSLSVVANLHNHFRAMTMHRIGKSRQAWNESIVRERWLMQRGSADGPRHCGSFENEEPHSPTGSCLVVSDIEIGDGAVVTTVLIHRRQHDAIPSVDRTYTALRQKLGMRHRQILRPSP